MLKTNHAKQTVALVTSRGRHSISVRESYDAVRHYHLYSRNGHRAGRPRDHTRDRVGGHLILPLAFRNLFADEVTCKTRNNSY